MATKRIFEVTGPQRIAGKSKGETVELELTDAQVAALVASGAVKEVTKTDKRSQGQKEE